MTVNPVAARYGLFPVVTVPKGTGFGILSAADSCAIRLTVAAESKRLYTRQTVKSSAGRGSTTQVVRGAAYSEFIVDGALKA